MSKCYARLPCIEIEIVGDQKISAIIDSGCSTTLIASDVPCNHIGGDTTVETANGAFISGAFVEFVFSYNGIQVSTSAIKIKQQSLVGSRVLLGMNTVIAMGGVFINSDGVQFASGFGEVAARSNPLDNCAQEGNGFNVVATNVEEPSSKALSAECDDFVVSFENNRWIARWKWNNDSEPKLFNHCAEYDRRDKETSSAFDKEIELWIDNEWLVPYSLEELGEPKGLLPTMAVVQRNKKKVRPVMDFRELNSHLVSFTGESAVCGEKLREWRQLGPNCSMLDLTKAYLQVHIEKALWPFQTIRFRGRLYALTRLGFGLCTAPKIMTAVLQAALDQDVEVRRGTSFYIDDIIVNESMISADHVRAHLSSFGLQTKDPVSLRDARVLGLRVFADSDGNLMWRRDNELPSLPEPASMTLRDVYSLTGRIVGHYPVAGELRPMCSLIKRLCESRSWDTPVSSKVAECAIELLSKVTCHDAVKGLWNVRNGGPCVVWSDASSLAIGICLEVDGRIVEDASWLRKKGDCMHINVAELEAAIKGVNLAVRWGFKDITLKSDSSTVVSWIHNTLTKEQKVRTKGTSEMLVRRRLQLMEALRDEYNIHLRVNYVSTSKNRADVLTRVPKSWLSGEMCCTPVVAAVANMSGDYEEVLRIHKLNHFGSIRTARLAALKGINHSKRLAKEVVKNCQACQSIDPAPVRWLHGDLSEKEPWHTLSLDVTHYNATLYLSILDNFSGFTLWIKLQSETADELVRHVSRVFEEHGVPKRVLVDNATSFHSNKFQELLSEFCCSCHFRAAHRPSGNGKVERIHRTIKSSAARSDISCSRSAFWWNVTPGDDGMSAFEKKNRGFVPFLPNISIPFQSDPVPGEYVKNQTVWVKPTQHQRCTAQWKPAVVTADQDGLIVPVLTETSARPVRRHVADLRHRSPVYTNKISYQEDPPVAVRAELSQIDGDMATESESAAEYDSASELDATLPAIKEVYDDDISDRTVENTDPEIPKYYITRSGRTVRPPDRF